MPVKAGMVAGQKPSQVHTGSPLTQALGAGSLVEVMLPKQLLNLLCSCALMGLR
jgi:hypothetical protein